MPYEEKEFTQYFLPYRELGVVKNANKDLLMNIDPVDGGKVHLKVFATSRQTVTIRLTGEDGRIYLNQEATITPEKVFEETIDVQGRSLLVAHTRIRQGRPHRARMAFRAGRNPPHP